MSGQNFWSVAVRHFTTTLEKGSFFTESIRKYHHASLCCDLYSILYPEYSTQLFPHLTKDIADQGRYRKAMGLLLLAAWLQCLNLKARQRGSEGAYETILAWGWWAGLTAVHCLLVSPSTRGKGHKMGLTGGIPEHRELFFLHTTGI